MPNPGGVTEDGGVSVVGEGTDHGLNVEFRIREEARCLTVLLAAEDQEWLGKQRYSYRCPTPEGWHFASNADPNDVEPRRGDRKCGGT